MPLWEQVKSNLVEWYSVAADKTEELTKIGVRRYDKFGISRDIERQFTELGSFVYNAVSEQREDFLSDPTLEAIVERIKGLEGDLQTKEKEIEEIRRIHHEKMVVKKEMAAQEGAKLDSTLVEGSNKSAILPSDEQAGSTPAQTAGSEGSQTEESVGNGASEESESTDTKKD